LPLCLCKRDFVFIHRDTDRSLTIWIADRGTRARIDAADKFRPKFPRAIALYDVSILPTLGFRLELMAENNHGLSAKRKSYEIAPRIYFGIYFEFAPFSRRLPLQSLLTRSFKLMTLECECERSGRDNAPITKTNYELRRNVRGDGTWITSYRRSRFDRGCLTRIIQREPSSHEFEMSRFIVAMRDYIFNPTTPERIRRFLSELPSRNYCNLYRLPSRRAIGCP